MGKIGVLAAGVTCIGQACPQTTAAAEPADASAAESLASPDPEPVADAAVLASIAEPSPAPVAQAASAPAAEPVVAVPAFVAPVVAAPVQETVDPATIDFTVKVSDTVGDQLMPLSIKGAAEWLAAVIERREVGERQSVYTALGAEGVGDAIFSFFVEDKGASTGFKGLLDGLAVIGMSARAVKAEEVEEFLAAGLGDPSSFEQEHATAIEELFIIVHPDNMVGGLTFELVSGLLAGRITNWSEVGGGRPAGRCL